MNYPDLFNGLFELGGAIALWQNVNAIKRDKTLKGVHWAPTLFFTSWGVFNLYFYPSQGLLFSFLGGVAVVAVNSIWLYYVWKFRPRQLVSSFSVESIEELKSKHGFELENELAKTLGEEIQHELARDGGKTR